LTNKSNRIPFILPVHIVLCDRIQRWSSRIPSSVIVVASVASVEMTLLLQVVKSCQGMPGLSPPPVLNLGRIRLVRNRKETATATSSRRGPMGGRGAASPASDLAAAHGHSRSHRKSGEPLGHNVRARAPPRRAPPALILQSHLQWRPLARQSRRQRAQPHGFSRRCCTDR
jgi:hypothetical protein